MVKRWIVYLFVLFCSAMYFVLYHYWFSWYLLVLTMLLLPFDLLISLPGMLTQGISFRVPNVLEQGSKEVFVVMTFLGKPFPSGCIKGRLRMTVDGESLVWRFRCPGTPGSQYDAEIDTSRSGLTIVELKRFWITSLLGLFSIPRAANCRAGVLILPAPIKPQNGLLLPRAILLRPKPGGGYSEDHDLRPYRQGEPLKNIHWKLSAKHDSLIIREPLVLSPHSRLVYITQWNGAHERDLILGRLLWISDFLLERDLRYFVKLGEKGPVAEIAKTEDLTDYLCLVLSGALSRLPNPDSLPTRFTWVFRADAGGAAQ